MLTDHSEFTVIRASFPKIAASLELLWGNPEFGQYIDKLFNDGRQGKREGFPEQTAIALWALARIHDVEFPQHAVRDSDTWPSSDASDRY